MNTKTAFVATVGMGTGPEADITKPLIKSIEEANPDFLLLFASPASESNARTIVNELHRDATNSRVHRLTASEFDVEALFKEMLDQLTILEQSGYEPGRTTADFTTGTKPMSAALALAACNRSLGRLKYISVKRNEQKQVCEGSERTLTFEPTGMLASATLRTALDMMKAYRFDAVRQLLEPLPDYLLSEAEKATRTCLLHLAEAYSQWDMFQHIRFKATYDKARLNEASNVAEFKAQPETVSAVMELGQKMSKGQLSDLAVIDLINNARRRLEEGKYDDAVARLYRACEMLAQWQLAKNGLATADIDLSKVPKKSVDWLGNCRGAEKKIQIGLYRSYQLLAEMEDEVGKQFLADKELQAVLNNRNVSILAHGTNPIRDTAAADLLSRIEALAKNVIDDYNTKSALLRFPWSR